MNGEPGAKMDRDTAIVVVALMALVILARVLGFS